MENETMRKSVIRRTTKETDISCELTVEGMGIAHITTGNAFFDHMLTLFTVHGLFDCAIDCKGDHEVDFHHSVEDIGICLGEAIMKVSADKLGIVRYGCAYIPMDESLARICCDMCGRPNLMYNVPLANSRINNFEVELVEDFFKAFTDHARITLHIDLLRGRNGHHSIEAVFKAFGHSLAQALLINSRASDQIPSSKGVL
jgi:imidazoleglycerol-phosphate dehydratase